MEQCLLGEVKDYCFSSSSALVVEDRLFIKRYICNDISYCIDCLCNTHLGRPYLSGAFG